MRISDWSSDVCSSDLLILAILIALSFIGAPATAVAAPTSSCTMGDSMNDDAHHSKMDCCTPACAVSCPPAVVPKGDIPAPDDHVDSASLWVPANKTLPSVSPRSEEPTSELQSLMRT